MAVTTRCPAGLGVASEPDLGSGLCSPSFVGNVARTANHVSNLLLSPTSSRRREQGLCCAHQNRQGLPNTQANDPPEGRLVKSFRFNRKLRSSRTNAWRM